MRMIKTLLVVFFVFLVTGMMVNATTYVTGKNWDTFFDLPDPYKANDYHIQGKIHSKGTKTPVRSDVWGYDNNSDTDWYEVGWCISKSLDEPDTWDFSIDFKTKDGKYIDSKTECHFGVEFNTEILNELEITGLLWTCDGEEIAKDSDVGFRVWDNPIGVTTVTFDHRLTDLLARPIDIAEVQFAVTDRAVPLRDMSREGLGVPGTSGNSQYSDIKWINYPGKLHIEPRSSVAINLTGLGIHLKEGQFLQMRYINAVTKEVSWNQHQHSTFPIER